MRWTFHKPTTPGWYWWRVDSTSEPEPVKVYRDRRDQQLYVYDDGSDYLLEKEIGQWAGPIEPPKEG